MKRLCLGLVLIAIATALAACGGPNPCVQFDGLPAPSSQASVGWRLLGSAVALKVPFGAYDGCKPRPTSVSAEVTDGSGAPVPATAELLDAPQPTALVRFAPAVTGTHTIRVDFSPGDPVEAHLMIARPPPPRLGADLPRACGRSFQLPSGAVLCDQYLFRGQTLEMERCGACMFAVSRDTVWEYSPGSVTRFVDAPTGPLKMTAELNATQTPLAFLHGFAASENDFLVASDSGVRRFVFRDGGIVDDGIFDERKNSSGLWIDGDDLLVAYGSVYVTESLCPYRISGDLLEAAPCMGNSHGPVVGSDANGLWFERTQNDPTGTPISSQLEVVGVNVGAPMQIAEGQLPRGYLTRSRGSGGPPVVSGNQSASFIAQLRDGAIELQLLER